MLSVAIQPSINASMKPSTFASQSVVLMKPFKASIFVKPKICFSDSQSVCELKLSSRSIRKSKFSASVAAAEANVAEETFADGVATDIPPVKEKLGVAVKPMEKPRLVLKFVWMEKNIGIALDQMIPGHGTIPLSPYYFWPRKDAWEELKLLLESKPWISQKQMIILLNQATDIINLWQQSGGDLS